MRILKSVRRMQRLAAGWKGEGVRIGFVPTMGYLHQGHLRLVNRARRWVGKRGKVVVSIFVNPAQFAPNEDLSRYPRDFRRDCHLCREAGVDAVFAPGDGDMYPPPGPSGFSTFVGEEKLSKTMEGVSRPTHFRGVTTVVAKLFNIVQPEVAVFGAKDWQQAAVVRRMARDLNFPLRIIVSPTVREKDGLAMSSRNKYLEGSLRVRALALFKAIREARRAASVPRPPPVAALKHRLRRAIEREPEVRVDYIEFFDPATLVPAAKIGRGVHLALAVFVGGTRLIDNARL